MLLSNVAAKLLEKQNRSSALGPSQFNTEERLGKFSDLTIFNIVKFKGDEGVI